MSNCSCNHEEVVQHENERDLTDADVWADEELRDTGTAAAKRSHEKQGYVDGLANAQSTSLQNGFDEAFPIGAKLGILSGEILGRLAANNENEKLTQAKEDLHITNILNKKYFNEDLILKGAHPVLESYKD